MPYSIYRHSSTRNKPSNSLLLGDHTLYSTTVWTFAKIAEQIIIIVHTFTGSAILSWCVSISTGAVEPSLSVGAQLRAVVKTKQALVNVWGHKAHCREIKAIHTQSELCTSYTD